MKSRSLAILVIIVLLMILISTTFATSSREQATMLPLSRFSKASEGADLTECDVDKSVNQAVLKDSGIVRKIYTRDIGSNSSIVTFIYRPNPSPCLGDDNADWFIIDGTGDYTSIQTDDGEIHILPTDEVSMLE